MRIENIENENVGVNILKASINFLEKNLSRFGNSGKLSILLLIPVMLHAYCYNLMLIPCTDLIY